MEEAEALGDELARRHPRIARSGHRSLRGCPRVPVSEYLSGGGDGNRTHGLDIANVALYQLSHTPEPNHTIPAPLTQA